MEPSSALLAIVAFVAVLSGCLGPSCGSPLYSNASTIAPDLYARLVEHGADTVPAPPGLTQNVVRAGALMEVLHRGHRAEGPADDHMIHTLPGIDLIRLSPGGIVTVATTNTTPLDVVVPAFRAFVANVSDADANTVNAWVFRLAANKTLGELTSHWKEGGVWHSERDAEYQVAIGSLRLNAFLGDHGVSDMTLEGGRVGEIGHSDGDWEFTFMTPTASLASDGTTVRADPFGHAEIQLGKGAANQTLATAAAQGFFAAQGLGESPFTDTSWDSGAIC